MMVAGRGTAPSLVLSLAARAQLCTGGFVNYTERLQSKLETSKTSEDEEVTASSARCGREAGDEYVCAVRVGRGIRTFSKNSGAAATWRRRRGPNHWPARSQQATLDPWKTERSDRGFPQLNTHKSRSGAVARHVNKNG
ncbi:hypothetical protein J6590_021146 [Homalodisca vitripennis]|nr:hypothetical protein J6590_021146 [Homalodisca vitripennis]